GRGGDGLMFVYGGKCSLCDEVKTGIPHRQLGYVCLECLVFSYQETVGEEDQDNEQLNERLGLTFS
ncbi:hypothetical protein, partial [Paludifilum halophilum]